MRPKSDWLCPGCGDANGSHWSICPRCGELRPPDGADPGGRPDADRVEARLEGTAFSEDGSIQSRLSVDVLSAHGVTFWCNRRFTAGQNLSLTLRPGDSLLRGEIVVEHTASRRNSGHSFYSAARFLRMDSGLQEYVGRDAPAPGAEGEPAAVVDGKPAPPEGAGAGTRRESRYISCPGCRAVIAAGRERCYRCGGEVPALSAADLGPPLPEGGERRWARRIEVTAGGALIRTGSYDDVIFGNIGRSGLMIQSEPPLFVGDLVKVKIELDDVMYLVDGIVRHSRRSSDPALPFISGIEFVDPPLSLVRHIARDLEAPNPAA